MELSKHKGQIRLGFLIWTVAVLYLLLSPGSGEVRDPYLFANEDKLVHFGLFFGWVVLAEFSWPNLSVILVLALVCVLAGGTEFLQQHIPNRSADVIDFVADLSGGVSAVLVTFLLKRK